MPNDEAEQERSAVLVKSIRTYTENCKGWTSSTIYTSLCSTGSSCLRPWRRAFRRSWMWELGLGYGPLILQSEPTSFVRMREGLSDWGM